MRKKTGLRICVAYVAQLCLWAACSPGEVPGDLSTGPGTSGGLGASSGSAGTGDGAPGALAGIGGALIGTGGVGGGCSSGNCQVVCGNRDLDPPETCDDGNTVSGDGCSELCETESNWECNRPGEFCEPICGDAVLVGGEECDPPNPSMGCSSECRLEPGFVCDAPGVPPNPSQPAQCHRTECGDGTVEGEEVCDDGNTIDGDGCSGGCSFEPTCTAGTCTSRCGDAIVLSPEQCDDGNVMDGDGCSSACLLEEGFTCEPDAAAVQDQLNLLVAYRDFISFPTGGSTRHADFEIFEGSDITPLLTLPMLDTEGKPALDGRCSQDDPASQADATLCPFGQMMTTATSFATWYRDTPEVNVSVPGTLLLQRQADGSYRYDSGNAGFYPIDAEGQIAAGREESFRADPYVNDGGLHNFGFTTEVRYFFQYNGGESLSFSGDDDLWIFINHTLALDVGGLHTRVPRTLDLDDQAAALGLELGNLYEIALFHAERHSAGSNFQLDLTGFVPTRSRCLPACGDGIVAGDEQCDFGMGRNVGGYNGCTEFCQNGPACGDDVIQPEFGEECDDGNLIDGDGCSGNCIVIVE